MIYVISFQESPRIVQVSCKYVVYISDLSSEHQAVIAEQKKIFIVLRWVLLQTW